MDGNGLVRGAFLRRPRVATRTACRPRGHFGSSGGRRPHSGPEGYGWMSVCTFRPLWRLTGLDRATIPMHELLALDPDTPPPKKLRQRQQSPTLSPGCRATLRMTMALTKYVLDEFVAPELSKLTAPKLESLEDVFGDRDLWLQGFVLRNIFQQGVHPDQQGLAFYVVRRLHASLDEWELAVAIARGWSKSTVGPYFRLLRHLEQCVANLAQAVQMVQKRLEANAKQEGRDYERLYEAGDGSIHERLDRVYNTSKHVAGRAAHLHVFWLRNDCMCVRRENHEDTLSFAELRQRLEEMGRVAQVISTSSGPPRRADQT